MNIWQYQGIRQGPEGKRRREGATRWVGCIGWGKGISAAALGPECVSRFRI